MVCTPLTVSQRWQIVGLCQGGGWSQRKAAVTQITLTWNGQHSVWTLTQSNMHWTDILGQAVYQRNAASLEDLWYWFMVKWDAIPQHQIQKLYKSKGAVHR